MAQGAVGVFMMIMYCSICFCFISVGACAIFCIKNKLPFIIYNKGWIYGYKNGVK